MRGDTRHYIPNSIDHSNKFVTPVHVLSMHAGRPHPHATTPVIYLGTDERPMPWKFCVRIRKAFIGIYHETTMEQKNELHIWNWRTGEQFAVGLADFTSSTSVLTRFAQHFTHNQVSTFAFFDDFHILVGLRNLTAKEMDVSSAVEVWMFADDEGRPINCDSSNAPYRLGALHLPRLRSHTRSMRVTFYENSLSASRLSSTLPGSFHTSQNDRLLVIKLQEDAYSDLQGTLCIPRHTLQKHVSRMMQAIQQSPQGLDIPWMDWGPNGSRLFFDENLSSTWICNSYGSRLVTACFIGSEDLDEVPNYSVKITVRDFSRFATRPSLAHGDQEHMITAPAWILNCPSSWTRCAEPEDVDIFLDDGQHRISEIFADDVSTRLPFNSTSRFMKQSFGEFPVLDAVMLAEDNILTVNYEVCAIHQCPIVCSFILF
jgi:hypothetical protein